MTIWFWIWVVLGIGGMLLSLLTLLDFGSTRAVFWSRIGFYMTLSALPFSMLPWTN